MVNKSGRFVSESGVRSAFVVTDRIGRAALTLKGNSGGWIT